MENVITNDVTLTVQSAGISNETRELLTIKAMLYDTVQSLHSWIEKYYCNSNDVCDDIYNKSSDLHDIIDKHLILNIADNMSKKGFKNI